MADRDRVWLEVGERAYGGWKSVSVEGSIETIAGGFSIGMADPKDSRIKVPAEVVTWPVVPGDACRVLIGDDPVIVGWIDDAEPELSPDNHNLTVTGRDRTADLVDCSAVHSPDEWNLHLEEVSRILCRDFGIEVSVRDISTGAAFKPFKLQPDETAFAAIERMCRMRAVLPMSDGVGGLVLTRAGSATTGSPIIEGKNLLWAKAHYSQKDRFSQYIVKGQTLDTGQGSEAAATVKATARDGGVKRYRPLVVLAEDLAEGTSPQERAQWEASVRAGRATRVSVKVQGWRQEDGKLWPLNGLVPVQIPTLGIEATLLIVSRRVVLDENGSTTELELARADAYRLLPEVPKGNKATGLPPGTEVVTDEKQLKGRAA